MVRIEYVSQYARLEVVNWLRGRVAVEELVLPPGKHPDRVVDQIIDTLKNAAHAERRTIVSISGFDRVVSEPAPGSPTLTDWLNAVNFQRESFALAGAGA